MVKIHCKSVSYTKKNRSYCEYIYTTVKVHKYSGSTYEVLWDTGLYTGLYRQSNYFLHDGI